MKPADKSSTMRVGNLLVEVYQTFMAGNCMDKSSEVKALVPNKHFLKVSATSSIVTFVFLQDVTIAFFLVHLDDQECYILIIFDISNKNFFEKILKIF